MGGGFRTLAVVGLLVVGALTGCRGDDGTPMPPKVGVILPDSRSSSRWESADRTYLEAAFRAAGIDYDIQNAQNDKQKFQTIADQMITNGVTVLMIVNLDSGTGKAVLDKAKAQGVATIDYDRLTLGGSAAYYVSFDNVAVGRLQGEGLVTCLAERGVTKPIIAELNGPQSDNNASLFKKGYDSVLTRRYRSGEFVKGPDRWVAEWDIAQAGTIFEQMLTSEPGITGVLAANDAIGNAAISVLKKNQLNGEVPVTGQDATVQGLRNILLGDQCMTVYKAIEREANTAAELAIGLARGKRKYVDRAVRDPKGKRDVPAVLLTPRAIYARDVKDVVDAGYVKASDLCAGETASRCAAAGIR